ncbi:HK97 gp10 family phage protein [Provencibacterium massiliense]|uniref:HK97 gp10 family phage protein n=1 Tax=Provencibacterium massiliense TaxID=1841868 RepID=UPI0009A74E88|nr:HK97 gp10 family phage protein [Provencibacterium massiliense]RGB69623.1 HK97 gp10 family phage protein [Harryflintia acetispora]
MSVNYRGSRDFQRKLEALRDAVPEIVDELIIGEGVHAVGEARKICKNEPGLVDTGHYRRNFHAGDKTLSFEGSREHDGSRPKQVGTLYKIDFYNNLDYAKHLEYGFRSHFVPAQYLSSHYRKRFPKGMYVGKPGSYVRGHFAFWRAVKRTRNTQQARLTRKLDKAIKKRMK